MMGEGGADEGRKKEMEKRDKKWYGRVRRCGYMCEEEVGLWEGRGSLGLWEREEEVRALGRQKQLRLDFGCPITARPHLHILYSFVV